MDPTLAQSRSKSGTKVAKGCLRSRKVAEGRRTKKKTVMSQSFTIISNIFDHFDKIAQRRKSKSRKVAKGRTKSLNVACICGDL
jgi:hypothetical protein